MNCKRAKEQISLFLDERLDPGSQSKLNEHLEGCSDCTNYLDDLKTGLAMLRDEAMESPSENFEWNLRRKIQLTMAQKETLRFEEHGDRRDLWRFGLSAAAALLIVVAGGTFWYQSQFDTGLQTEMTTGNRTSSEENATVQGRPGWIESAPGGLRPVVDRTRSGSGRALADTDLDHGRPLTASPADSITGQDLD
jgi:hypothetical protein